MEEVLNSFTDEDYRYLEIDGRMTLQLHGEESKRKRIEADKIPKIYEAMREGWDIDIRYAVIDGTINILQAGLVTDNQDKYVIAGRMSFRGASFIQDANFIKASFQAAYSKRMKGS